MDNIDCDGGSPDTAPPPSGLTLAPDDHVTCTFANSLAPPTTGSIKVIKTVVGGAPGSVWSFSGTAPINTFTLPAAGGDQTFSDLTPGSFTITETRQGGWVPSVSCTPGSETGVAAVTLDLAAGERPSAPSPTPSASPAHYDNGGNACVPADPGHFVATAAAIAQTQCPAGTWQDLEGQDSCKRADPGFYVPEPGATEQINARRAPRPKRARPSARPSDRRLLPGRRPASACCMTDGLGIGQGSPTKGIRTRKLVIPDYQDVDSLYGQLASVESGGVMKYVRFRYPNGSKVQIYDPTSPAYRAFAVNWWGSELDTGYKYIKGQFFWGAKGNKMPRAFVLWPTYNTTEEYANVFTTFGESIDEPRGLGDGLQPQRDADHRHPGGSGQRREVTVQIAVVDVNKDTRTVTLTVEAGGVSEARVLTVPNSRDLLNLEEFVLENVPAGTDEVTITLESPDQTGDSAAMIGAAVNYACELDVP